jgi:hypothetical protein
LWGQGVVLFGLPLLSAAAVWYFFSRGYLLWYGDAEAHLNAARRLFDSQTPGTSQFGTPWLPLPHLLTLPFTVVDSWWRSGLAAAIPAACAFVIGGYFLFAATRRIFSSTAAAVVATALAALNPNLLYMQSTSMTEAYFFAELAALLYFTVADLPVLAGLVSIAATFTRYDGWFLLPFVALYFLIRRPRNAFIYAAIAALGPLAWLAHNWYWTGDALAFYRGPYSARAIQHGLPYPGLHNAPLAWLYYRTAAELCAGPGLALMAVAGAVVAAARKAIWPLILLALPPLFYLWSMYSSGGTPIFTPGLWPHSYYNTRYGLAALPLLAFASAALVLAVPERIRALTAVFVIIAGTIHWAVQRSPEAWVTWAESGANSIGRRAWTDQAAQYLAARYHPGVGILSSGGDDFFGIYRTAGIPLRETFSVDNGLVWDAAVARPDLYFSEGWAITRQGDELDDAVRLCGQYQLELTIAEKDEPVIAIYRRTGGP